MKQELVAFEQKRIRKIEFSGEMYYSVLDVIEHFTKTVAPQTEWARLKRRNFTLVKMCKQLKMKALNGAIYTTDALNRAGIFRLLMSMPSPNAEFLKTLLSRAGTRAIAETEDPELGFNRLPTIKKTTIYSNAPKHLTSPDFDGALTTEWRERGVDKDAFWLLNATILTWTFGLSLAKHKALKRLNHENLYEHLTPIELIFIALGEEVTRCFIIKDNAQGFLENIYAAQKGGDLAGKARLSFEKTTGLKVVSRENYLGLNDGNSIEELPENT